MADMPCRYQTVAGLALFKMFMGGTTLVAGIFLITKRSWAMDYWHGVIGGAWLLSAGFVGTCGGCSRSKVIIFIYMILSFLSMTVVAGALAVLSYLGYKSDNKFTMQEHLNSMTDEQIIECKEEALGSIAKSKEGYINCANKTGVIMNEILIGIAIGLVIIGLLSVIFASRIVFHIWIEKRYHRQSTKVQPFKAPPPDREQLYKPLKGRYGFSEAQINRARSLFDQMDSNNDGTMSIEELGKMVKVFGFEPTHSELVQLQKEVDKNNDGKIEFEELIMWLAGSREENFTPRDVDLVNRMRQKYYPLPKELIFEILKIFKVLDATRDYVLSMDEFAGALPKMGTFVHPQHLKELHMSVDENRDGLIDFEEFLKLALKTAKL